MALDGPAYYRQMRRMKMNSNINLGEILERHQRWIQKSDGWSPGDRAVLYRCDLSYADLAGVNLFGADLSGANLFGADFTGANLLGVDFTSAILSKADLTNANLTRANLLNANLHKAVLHNTNFLKANLFEANIADTDLSGAINFPLINFVCPAAGRFIGWKKALSADGTEVIVELSIPEDAKRSSATGRKCRCNKAEVLSIQDEKGTDYSMARSMQDDTFTYVTGATVTSAFDDNRWHECSDGIHFYMTKTEAAGSR